MWKLVKKTLLIGVLLVWLVIGGYFVFNFAVFVMSPLPSAIPTPSSPARKIVKNGLQLDELWRWNGFIDTPAILIEDNVVIFSTWKNDGSHIMVFNARNGELIWESERIWGLDSIDVDDNRIYIGAGNYIRAYDLKTGNILWKGLQQSIHKHGSLYVYSKEGILEVYDSDSAHRPLNRFLHIIDSQSGEKIKTIDYPDIYFHYEDIYYVTSYSAKGFNYHLSAENNILGETYWQFDVSDGLRRWPIINNDTMYLDAGMLYALDFRTGELLWQSNAGLMPDIETGNRTIENSRISRIDYGAGLIYVVRSDGAIVGLDATSGQEIGEMELEPMPNYSDVHGYFDDSYFIIAASDKYVAVFYGDSQELIVFSNQRE